MALFQKGQSKIGGRGKGVRNRLSNALLEALAKDFEEHGEEAVRITRVERPAEYLKIVAGIMPKELEITDSRLKEIDDNELDYLIELARQRRLAVGKKRRLTEDRLRYYRPIPNRSNSMLPAQATRASAYGGQSTWQDVGRWL